MKTLKIYSSHSTKRNTFLGCILTIFIVLGYGCSSINHKPGKISVLAAKPMNHTAISSYLSLDTFYRSDGQIALVASWGRVQESKGHTLKWEIVNSKGKQIFSTVEEDVTIYPHTYTCDIVSLDQFSENDLKPGDYTISLYIDDNLMQSRVLSYSDKNITSRDQRQVVILPFYETCRHPDYWDEASKVYFQNSIAAALYCEIKRVVPDTIPHYVSEQKIGKILQSNCFDNKECTSFVKNQFGESIYIFGYSYMQQLDIDTSFVTLFVYDAKTDNKKKYHYASRYLDSHSSSINDILKGILYERGLLADLGAAF